MGKVEIFSDVFVTKKEAISHRWAEADIERMERSNSVNQLCVIEGNYRIETEVGVPVSDCAKTDKEKLTALVENYSLVMMGEKGSGNRDR